MPAKRVIPCLDVKDGWVVKGVQFEGLRSLGDPLTLARRYAEEGADELVFLDIAARAEGRETQVAWVSLVAHALQIPLTVGGGIASVDQVRQLLRAGADKVAVNSAALVRPQLIDDLAREFGSQCVVLALDVARDAQLGHRVFRAGGKEPTARAALAWGQEAIARGAGELLATSIDRDGTLEGFDLALVSTLAQLEVPTIASGGAGEPRHFLEALEAGASGVLAATLFHEGRLRLPDLKQFLRAKGQVLRP